MKKILITAFAAVVCFCSCMTSVEDYIYSIDLARENGKNSVSINDPEGQKLVKEFVEAINEFSSKNSSNWQWIETIYNRQTSKADASARKIYDKYNAEVKSIIDTYQAKFNAADPDPKSVYEVNYDFVLCRSLGGKETISSTKYSIHYGK